MPPSVLGLDIGGANLKAAHTGGTVVTRPFELWRRPGELPDALRFFSRENGGVLSSPKVHLTIGDGARAGLGGERRI